MFCFARLLNMALMDRLGLRREFDFTVRTQAGDYLKQLRDAVRTVPPWGRRNDYRVRYSWGYRGSFDGRRFQLQKTMKAAGRSTGVRVRGEVDEAPRGLRFTGTVDAWSRKVNVVLGITWMMYFLIYVVMNNSDSDYSASIYLTLIVHILVVHSILYFVARYTVKKDWEELQSQFASLQFPAE